MRLPDSLVIGAPKRGTTSLPRYLSAHPEVYLPIQKELHFFTNSYIKGHMAGPNDLDVLECIPKTFPEYAAHFEGVCQETAVGEVSPSYLYFSDSDKAIKQQLGDVKIIASPPRFDSEGLPAVLASGSGQPGGAKFLRCVTHGGVLLFGRMVGLSAVRR